MGFNKDLRYKHGTNKKAINIPLNKSDDISLMLAPIQGRIYGQDHSLE